TRTRFRACSIPRPRHTHGARSEIARVKIVYTTAVCQPKMIPMPPTMTGLSRGDEMRKVIAVWKATPALSIPTSMGSVEQEQNGVTAPKASPLTGPGTRPLLIQLRIFSGPNRRLINATAVDTITKRASSSPSRSEKVARVSLNINSSCVGLDVRLHAARLLPLRRERCKVSKPLDRGGKLFTTDRNNVRPSLGGGAN